MWKKRKRSPPQSREGGIYLSKYREERSESPQRMITTAISISSQGDRIPNSIQSAHCFLYIPVSYMVPPFHPRIFPKFLCFVSLIKDS